MSKNEIIETAIAILGTREELNRIYKTFNELKMVLGISKKFLYTKALLWIVENKKAQSEFIRYIQNEKEKILKRIIE